MFSAEHSLFRLVILLSLLLFVPRVSVAAESSPSLDYQPLQIDAPLAEAPDSGLSRSQKAWLINVGAVGGVMAWGLLNWDYFSQSPSTENEDWFGHSTKEGGADKLGHLWTAYALSHGFAEVYRHIGYDEADALLYGPLSSFAVTGLMEVGDSFSDDHGFSYEDMVANLFGAGAGYLLLRYPVWQKRIDLRWEYNPDVSDFESDITTDYQNAKYLLALKAEGFEQIENPVLQALELHLGYYARNYDGYKASRNDDRKRFIYAGVGINVGRLIRPLWDTRLFNYLQLPYTYLEVRDQLD